MSIEEAPPPRLNYGGQAVIEGVMMRGTRAMAVAIRNPQGDIVLHTEPLNQRIYGSRLARTPFVRGLTLLWDALGLGMKVLMFSADVSLMEETDDETTAAAPPEAAFSKPAQWGTIALSLTLAIGLFFALPAFVAGLLAGQLEAVVGRGNLVLTTNIVEGVIRLGLLVGYIWAIGRVDDIKRLFRYHGAEHKTINAYEAGAELTPASVARFPLEHPRCGTGFLLTVVVISILLYTMVPLPTDLSLAGRLLVRVGSRILLLPVVAGVAYEFLRFTAANQHRSWVRAITRPNLALQRLTTAEPDESMLTVAITAFETVLAADAREDTEIETRDVVLSGSAEPIQI